MIGFHPDKVQTMKRLANKEGQSLDITEENLQAMKAIFPAAFTEDGIDFDTLRQLLGTAVASSEEKYGLTWHGKKRAHRIALTPSLATLRPCREESVDWDSSQNLFIEGENLEVLKILQRSYAGKVKMIYIDPPYNTGNEFIYPDSYQDSMDLYLRYTGQKTTGGLLTTSEKEHSGRFHTNWLNMMYPRLFLARHLLRKDGVIFVSIGEDEFANLKHIMDAVFGEDNYIGAVMWNSTTSITSTALMSNAHTYNLVFAKSKEYFKENRYHFRFPETGDGFDNPDNDPRGPWKADPFQVGGQRPNQLYTITNPKTGKTYKPRKGNSWKNDYRTFQKLLTDNRIVFGKNGDAGPQRKRFLTEALERGRVANTWWQDVGTTTNATSDLNALFDADAVFSNPKPVDLIENMLQLGDHTKQGIILDFFAGSATTAHAVMHKNAKDGGNRRFIMVQLPQPCNEKTEPHESDFATIAAIGRQRIRLAAAKIKKEHPEYNGDLGFKSFKLDSSNLRVWNPHPDNLEQNLLDHVEHLIEGRSEQDMLYEILLKRGLELSASITTKETAGKKLHCVVQGERYLFACLDATIAKEDIEPLARAITDWHRQMQTQINIPPQVFFRDSAFADDIAKSNMVAILQQRGIEYVRSL